MSKFQHNPPRKPMNPIIGIVVPIYNVEKYLRQCLDSLVHQTYRNLQIVLVNDGSTDQSLEIAKEYLKKDSRFILIDKPNGGLSSARNTGIEFFKKSFLLKPCDENQDCFKVIGDNPRKINSIFSSSPPPTLEEISYLFFVDSDDAIHLDCLETYLKYAEENSLEIVASGVEEQISEHKNGKFSFGAFKGVPRNQVLSGETMFYKLSQKFFYAAWNILINFEFFKKTQLYFIDGILYEDCAFGTLLFLQAKRVMVLEHYFYIYRFSQDSITRPKKMTEERRILDFKSWYEIIKRLEASPSGKDVIEYQITYCYLPMLYLCLFKIKNKEKYTLMLEEFKYKSFRIFFARYFGGTFLFFKKIKRFWERSFEFLR